MGGGDGAKEHPPHYLGHRERARERLEELGPEALADYELLEVMLFRVLPRRDTKPIAKALLRRFGSFSEVLAAPPARLVEVEGVGPSVARHLKEIHAAARRYGRDLRPARPLVGSFDALLEYCRADMAFESREQFRVLFLDKRNAIIADEVLQVGTVDHAPVYPREVVKRALELAATALILVHNHPSGDPRPSDADIRMTRTIVDVARPLGIVVHDHIIVGKDGHVSFRAQKLI